MAELLLRSGRGTVRPFSKVAHGSQSGYQYWGCRCPACRAWNNRLSRRWRVRYRSQPMPAHVQHGTRYAYETYGCTCAECRAANAAQARRLYWQRKGASGG